MLHEVGPQTPCVEDRVVDRRVVRRSAALGEVAEMEGLGDFGALAAGAGSEVAVLESVAVAFG
jgi:hypothetical protein